MLPNSWLPVSIPPPFFSGVAMYRDIRLHKSALQGYLVTVSFQEELDAQDFLDWIKKHVTPMSGPYARKADSVPSRPSLGEKESLPEYQTWEDDGGPGPVDPGPLSYSGPNRGD